MSKITIPPDLKGKELYKFLTENKSILIAEKKMQFKIGDEVCVHGMVIDKEGRLLVDKAAKPAQEDGTLKVKSVINSCNWFDSHGDVHIPGLWNKSLKDNKSFYLLQEHKMAFDKIITEEVKAYVKNIAWKSLGYDVTGTTEVLIFDSEIGPKRNKFMYDQYADGYVKNHSVGMRYVNLQLAINDEDFKAEFATWNKYIDDIANRDEVEEAGYFWPVLEAKVLEGSAVPIGSNIMTPTLETTGKAEPVVTTTQEQPKFNVMEAIKNHKFIF